LNSVNPGKVAGKSSICKGTYVQYNHVEKKVKADLSKEELMKELIATKNKIRGLEKHLNKKSGWENRINQQLGNLSMTSREITKIIEGFNEKLNNMHH